MTNQQGYLERRALRLEQPGGHVLYLFTLAPAQILEVADISRVARDDGGRLIGYQRPGVQSHVRDIQAYLEGEQVVFPNSIILALDPTVRFRSSRGPHSSDGLATGGTLEIPVGGRRKPAWIVDGQQRALALAAVPRGDLPVPVSAFVTDDVDIQRDQFIRVNNIKPLPRGLVTELLPETTLSISPRLAARKLPSALCDQLHRSMESPFHGLIRRPSAGAEERRTAVVADTSVVKMIEESLTSSSGCLFPFRNLATGETDTESIWKVLTVYWAAVRDTFPDAWGRPPTESRLMHGAGIVAMGRLMDKIMSTVNPNLEEAPARVRGELALVADVCRWTSGSWTELGGLPWNDVQNLPKHTRALSSLLIRRYVSAKLAA
jgi:DGQHR domain-containing protein